MEIQKQIIDALANEKGASDFAAYVAKSIAEKDRKTGKLKNPHFQNRSAEFFVDIFNRVKEAGLVFDGKHVTLQQTGITLDYVAYKNKMLVSYPESKISIGVVYDGDSFSFSECDGKVRYTHEHSNPFNKSDDKIIGVYVVIRNKRGEFLTTLDMNEIKKHRAVSKGDFIWKAWFVEMCKKTVMKKACKYHFDDVVTSLDEIDNENYDLDLPIQANTELKDKVNSCKTLEELTELYKKENPTGEDLKLFSLRKGEINGDS